MCFFFHEASAHRTVFFVMHIASDESQEVDGGMHTNVTKIIKTTFIGKKHNNLFNKENITVKINVSLVL